jgi:hypothetical protein
MHKPLYLKAYEIYFLLMSFVKGKVSKVPTPFWSCIFKMEKILFYFFRDGLVLGKKMKVCFVHWNGSKGKKNF